MWMLRSAQQDKSDVIPHTFFVIPNAVRNPVHGCFTSFSMTKRRMRSVQHDGVRVANLMHPFMKVAPIHVNPLRHRRGREDESSDCRRAAP